MVIGDKETQRAVNSLMRKEVDSLNEIVNYTNDSLDDLLIALERSIIANSVDGSVYNSERTRKECDKIAVSIEDFYAKFSEIYDELNAVYLAEKMAQSEKYSDEDSPTTEPYYKAASMGI